MRRLPRSGPRRYPLCRDGRARWMGRFPAVLLTVFAIGYAVPAHAVTSITVDGQPSPAVLTIGEGGTFRFDVGKAGAVATIALYRDLSRSGRYEPTLPIYLRQTVTDGGGGDRDVAPGRVAFRVESVGGHPPAGSYLFTVDDPSDGTFLALGITVAPRPEPQSISGRVSVVAPGGAQPTDAIIWAYKDAQTPVTSANIRPDGSFMLPLLPGTYLLFAEWYGSLRSQRQVVTLAAGQQLSDVHLPLLKAQEVNGKVTHSGSPSADAMVQAVAADGNTFSARTFTDGSYMLALPRGQYRITAPGGAENITVSDQPLDGIDFPPVPDGPAPAKGVIVTVAGNGLTSLGGDGRRAVTARVPNPNFVLADRQGNLYIADSVALRVRVVREGIISTLAGDANPESLRFLLANSALYGRFGGDDGPATSAQLNSPSAVALDAQGDLYIVDVGNHRIRKVDARGIITTVAGSGPADQGGFAGDGGLATAARLNRPSGVAVDASGNLYIVDNRRVRKVGRDGIITTVAGGGATPLADGLAATAVALVNPSRVVVDGAGNLYVSERGLARILKVAPSGTMSIVAGTGTPGYSGDGGPATAAQLASPIGLALDTAGNLFFADLGAQVVRKVGADGIISTVAGTGVVGVSGDGGPATQAQLWSPISVTIDGAGNLYYADLGSKRIRKVVGIASPGLVVGQ